MATIQDIEDQKQREAGWVQQGVDRFRAHCDRAVSNNAAVATAGGKALMKRTHVAFIAALEAYEAEASLKPHAAKDRILPIIAILGVDHVAAVVIASVLKVVLKVSGSASKERVAGRAKAIGQALEHDVRLNVWAKNADAAEKAAIAHLKKRVEADPRSWRRRAAQLRELAGGEEPWDDADCVALGLDLAAILCRACPDVFVAKVVGQGAQMVRTMNLTDEAAALVADVETFTGLTSPRVGAMIVPPRPWSYA